MTIFHTSRNVSQVQTMYNYQRTTVLHAFLYFLLHTTGASNTQQSPLNWLVLLCRCHQLIRCPLRQSCVCRDSYPTRAPSTCTIPPSFIPNQAKKFILKFGFRYKSVVGSWNESSKVLKSNVMSSPESRLRRQKPLA